MTGRTAEYENIGMPTFYETHGRRLAPELENRLPEWLQNNPKAETRVVITKWGGITLVSSPMAERFPNSELLSIVDGNFAKGRFEIPQYLSPQTVYERAKSLIEASGITLRHRSPALSETRSQEDVIDDASSIGALLLDLAVTQHGRIPAQVFVTNLNLPHTLTERVIFKSQTSGGAKAESIRAACGAQLVALIKAKLDPKLKNETIAIVSTEPSGSLQEPNHYQSLDHLAMPATFTDLYSIMVINLEEYELLDQAIHVIPGGGIEVDVSYKDEIADRQPIPSYLTPYVSFEQGEDGRTGESVLVMNRHGVFLDIKAPENGMHATMNGLVTAKHFRDHTPHFAARLKQHLFDVFTYHNASESVFNQVKKMYRKLGLGEIEELVFRLPLIGTGNGTSATNFADFQYVLETTKPLESATVGALSMAIGSLFARAVFKRVG